MDVVDSTVRPAFDAHVLPDADVGQLWPPVPAEVARGLAQVWTAWERLLGSIQRPDRVQFRSSTHRRAKDERDLVFAWSNAAGHVPSPFPEHVVRVPQRLAVETDLGQRVEAVEDQLQALLSGHGRVDGERAAVFPVPLGDPLDTQLLVADERIGN